MALWCGALKVESWGVRSSVELRVFCLAARGHQVWLVGGGGPCCTIEGADVCVWFVLGRGTSGSGGLWTPCGLVFCLGTIMMDIRQQGLVGEWWGCTIKGVEVCVWGVEGRELGVSIEGLES
jgi:hypothetical protein